MSYVNATVPSKNVEKVLPRTLWLAMDPVTKRYQATEVHTGPDRGVWLNVWESAVSYRPVRPCTRDYAARLVTLAEARAVARRARKGEAHESGLPRRGLVLHPDRVFFDV